jgi:glycosyltransferase involved in cell wall biosynthesis
LFEDCFYWGNIVSICEDSKLVVLLRTNLGLDGRLSQESPLQLVRGTEPDASSIQPIVTVVVIAYRHESYIKECLSSINGISIESFELLIIDDGSPDKTLSKCLEFQFRPGIEVRVYTKPNHGLVHSLFCGLELARGQYVSFMASDDLYIEGGLEQAIHYLQPARPSVDALFCQAVTLEINEGGKYLCGSVMDKFFSGTPLERFDAICTFPPKLMLLQATIFKTNFLRNLHPWDDNLALDDWPTFIRLFAAEAYHAAIVRYEPELKLCMYRISEGSLSNNLDRQLKITAQVANFFVPLRYRKLCLAYAQISNGLIHIYRGRWWKGAKILLHGVWTSPTLPVFSRLTLRVWKFVQKKFRVAIAHK